MNEDVTIMKAEERRVVGRRKPKLSCYELKRVCAYARVSSIMDSAGNSLSAQINYYEGYIKNHVGWEYAGIYADDGISGTKVNRPEFQKMLTACRNGEVDMIITKSITRFARNTMVLLETLRELKRLGVNVVFEKENIETASTAGELMLTILGTFAEEEAKSASLNQLWRIKRMFENGEITPTRMLGYYTENKTLKVIPEEAEVVRIIYSCYLSGMGIPSIARELENRGIRTTRGNQYDKRVLRKILTNEKYKGDLILQKSYTKDFRVKRTIANQGEKPMYYVEDAHEAIIDKETWNAVQDERARRKEIAHKNSCVGYKSGPYLFTRLITCGNCNAHYIRKSRHGKTIWTCKTYSEAGKAVCSNSAILEDILIERTAFAIHAVNPKEDCSSLSIEQVNKYIAKIIALKDKTLVFHMRDGSEILLRWENPSRSKSWTDEMKAEARKKALERIGKEVEDGKQ